MSRREKPRFVTLCIYNELSYVSVSSPPQRRSWFWIGTPVHGVFAGLNRKSHGCEEYLALAKELGRITSELKEKNLNLRQVWLRYNDRRGVETFYLDGYWGRPAIPAESIGLKPLGRKQIQNLRDIIEQLKQKGDLPKLLVA